MFESCRAHHLSINYNPFLFSPECEPRVSVTKLSTQEI